MMTARQLSESDLEWTDCSPHNPHAERVRFPCSNCGGSGGSALKRCRSCLGDGVVFQAMRPKGGGPRDGLAKR